MNLNQIAFIEIRLIPLFLKAKEARPLAYDIKNKYWYKILKPEMLKLVGFDAENAELRSTEIYDKVYFYCMELMGLNKDDGIWL